MQKLAVRQCVCMISGQAPSSGQTFAKDERYVYSVPIFKMAKAEYAKLL